MPWFFIKVTKSGPPPFDHFVLLYIRPPPAGDIEHSVIRSNKNNIPQNLFYVDQNLECTLSPAGGGSTSIPIIF